MYIACDCINFDYSEIVKYCIIVAGDQTRHQFISFLFKRGGEAGATVEWKAWSYDGVLLAEIFHLKFF